MVDLNLDINGYYDGDVLYVFQDYFPNVKVASPR